LPIESTFMFAIASTPITAKTAISILSRPSAREEWIVEIVPARLLLCHTIRDFPNDQRSPCFSKSHVQKARAASHWLGSG
jgi:hypothetical protein